MLQALLCRRYRAFRKNGGESVLSNEFLPVLDGMMESGLVTIQKAQVLRYSRQRRRFARPMRQSGLTVSHGWITEDRGLPLQPEGRWVVRFALDSPVEESGFEPSVPRDSEPRVWWRLT
jgi:hypothetical protein